MKHFPRIQLRFNKYSWGIWFTIILSTAVLYLFYGNILKNPNQVYFASGGDGLQNYYNHIYHVKYDSTYFRSSSMNYPYGEMIYYTGVQLIPASILKFCNSNIFNISEYMIGIQNIMMLLSIVLASLFLYLLFRQLKLPIIESTLFSVFIAFLSPQLDRFGGHFSLAYVFVVPLIFYLYILFFKKPGLFLSLIIGIFAFWAFTTQPYFFGMLAIIWLFYWAYWFLLKKEKDISHFNAIIYCFIQLILPYLIIQLFSIIYDPITDRTNSPWGFLVYRAYPEGVFLPFGTPYGKFLYLIFKSTNYIDWEGIAYIGLISIAGTMVLMGNIVKKIINRNFSGILDITDNRILNIFFWASFVALLYSFGIPFVLGMEWLVDYSGPLKQMRGIGRFAWLYFYLINIVSVYIIWKWATTRTKKIIFWIALLILGYDSYLNVRNKENYLNNKISELSDINNILPENDWVKYVHSENYQAILPIPYFNIGSENIWISPKCDDMGATFIASLKTGLPTTAILLSRTSISQSYKNLEVALEPYRNLEILNDYPNKKPLLLLVCKCEFQPGEENLIKNAKLIYHNEKISFYELSFEKLNHLADSLYSETLTEYNNRNLVKFDNLRYSKDTLDFVYLNFDTLSSTSAYIGKGAIEAKCDEYTNVFRGILPDYLVNTDYVLSFWYGNILKDVSLRGQVFLTYSDSTGKVYKEDCVSIGKSLKIIDGNWSLFEFVFRLNSPNDIVSVTFKNFQLKKEILLVDELLIRPKNGDLYKMAENGIIKNNRLYLKN